MLSQIMLSVIMPSVIMPSVIMLSVIMLSVIMLSAVMLSVMATITENFGGSFLFGYHRGYSLKILRNSYQLLTIILTVTVPYHVRVLIF